MTFIADFHVHSKYSRATSKQSDIEHIYMAARQKGINVVGTGDFTHPEWFAEIKEKLEPAEPGLYKLRETIAAECDAHTTGPACRGVVRFILSVEISNIYKKAGKTRKNHNLVFLPDLGSVERFNAALERIGNIRSDGRPILGLDAKNLLDLLLETDDTGFLVPAHIWTPWFSLLGSKSGFDSLEACFEELSPYIFAAETGLSSDPSMNWRVSGLDRLTLISNSDAHSPSKLGREANRFDSAMDFFAIKTALQTGNPQEFLGTYEFFPEEGKYHLDGHRKCGVRWWPRETLDRGGACSVCGKPVTRGVLHRVEELADRSARVHPQTVDRRPYATVLPLADILAEILGVGPQSKKVNGAYKTALEKLGSEFDILDHLPVGALKAAGIPLLDAAIEKMRAGKIHIHPGFDGEFGTVRIFTTAEKERLQGQQRLFAVPCSPESDATALPDIPGNASTAKLPSASPPPHSPPSQQSRVASREQLNIEQHRAVRHRGAPLLIVAGPGTGKTMTLTHRIAALINDKTAAADQILAVTFTNKAAREMADRLVKLLPSSDSAPLVTTFHAFCVRVLMDINHKPFTILDDAGQMFMIAEAIRQAEPATGRRPISPATIKKLIATAKQHIKDPGDNLTALPGWNDGPTDVYRALYATYQELLTIQGVYDFEDLIVNVVRLLERDRQVCRRYRDQYRYICVDEYQDLNAGQYRLIKALAPPEAPLCVIGDPDQSIYGFRGSDTAYFNRFVDDYPSADVIHLKKNYRSTETILEASYQVIRDQHTDIAGSRTYSDNTGHKTISILEARSEKAEAVAIGKTVEQMMGGVGFHSIDFGSVTEDGEGLGFSDFAVLFRTRAQIAIFEEVFTRAGIPFQTVVKDTVYDRPGIRELLSCFRFLNGVASYEDLERMLLVRGSGIGKKTAAALKSWCFQNRLSVSEAVAHTQRFPVTHLDHGRQSKLNRLFASCLSLQDKFAGQSVPAILTGLKVAVPAINTMIDKDRHATAVFNRIVATAGRYPDRPRDFLTHISLQTDTDQHDYDTECVSLMTIHAAKGLEFPVVFIAGCENGLIPYGLSPEGGPIGEEKRLFYVGMTRAKKRLFLTRARHRTLFGATEPRSPSPFLDEIETVLLSHITPPKRPRSEKKAQQIQLDLFS